MTTTIRRLLVAVLLIPLLGLGLAPTALARSAGTTAAAGAASVADDPSADIKDRLAGIPGLTVTEEQPTTTGHRYFLLTYTQPIDHARPWLGTFQQRLSVLHKGYDRPTVFYTNGYTLRTAPSRTEPARLVDGNQVSIEYRYFTPSRPEPADWSKAGIKQAATDAHRLITALKRIYQQEWLSTGASKGGMSSTYHRRFFPDDVAGTIAYVAPNDVDEREDSAYSRFFRNVGTPECRAALTATQRELLARRDRLEPRYAADNAAAGSTFTTIGSADKAYELAVLDSVWAFWQYSLAADCVNVPRRRHRRRAVRLARHPVRHHRQQRPGARRVHRVLLPGRHRAGLALLRRLGPQGPAALRLQGAVRAAHLCAACHPDALRPVRDARHRPLGAELGRADHLRLRPERPVGRRAVPSRVGQRGQLRLHGAGGQPRLQHRQAAGRRVGGGHREGAGVGGLGADASARALTGQYQVPPIGPLDIEGLKQDRVRL